MVTPALPAAPVYSQTIPPPGVGVCIGPLKEPPRAASAWARVGHVAAPVVATAVVVVAAGAAVVAVGAVVDEDGDVVVVVELVLLDPQPVRARPTARAPIANGIRVFMTATLDPFPWSEAETGGRTHPSVAAGHDVLEDGHRGVAGH